jgi:type I restriction enzyme S subunit
MNWSVEPVSQFTEAFEGGKNLQADDESAVDARYRILKVSAVTWQEYDPQESKPLPPDYEPPTNHFVRQGDLLFSRANTTELVGATAYIFSTPDNMILPDKIWRFVWREPRTVDPLYIWSLFQDPYIRYQLGQRATGTSGSMKNISMPKVLSLTVPVPPLELQQEFAGRVRLIRRISEQQMRSKNELEILFQSLLQRAFRGEV